MPNLSFRSHGARARLAASEAVSACVISSAIAQSAPADSAPELDPISVLGGRGRDGKPVTCGVEMWNGAGEPMISIVFVSPFIKDDDSLTETPDFLRLATWRTIFKRWLGRAPEALDEDGRGFAHG